MSAQHEWSPVSVQRVAHLLAGRWFLPVVHALRDGPLRRNTLRAQIGSVSDKVLTETLQRMAEQGLIERIAIPTVPVEVDYALTRKAHTLWPILASMHTWATRHPAPNAADMPDCIPRDPDDATASGE